MTAVRFENLVKQFGATVALRDINLTIEAGELFFLLGPSGCGKSTLLRCVAGLHEPTSGRIFFNDRDVTSLPTQKRNAVMCFQSYALWPHMTVRENVRFGLEIQKADAADREARVDEVLRLVQMESLADRKPNQLSGGQQQRVALARALVVRPACLLLDEPLSNLDARLRLEMRGEIRRICRQARLTTIYVTHDQKEALSIADRMAILRDGVIEQVGRPQEVYLRPDNRFVAHFMGETNFLEGRVEAIDGQVARVRTEAGVVGAAVNGHARQGARVTLSIRPEVIHLGEAPADAANRLTGAVHDTVYLGEVAQHLFTTRPGGASLRAFELNPRFYARDDSTQETTAWIDPADVVILEGPGD